LLFFKVNYCTETEFNVMYLELSGIYLKFNLSADSLKNVEIE